MISQTKDKPERTPERNAAEQTDGRKCRQTIAAQITIGLSPPQRFERSLYKCAVLSECRRKVEWIDHALSAVADYSADLPEKKLLEPLRRRETIESLRNLIYRFTLA